MFSLKSIQHIVLRKGGKDVTFITYAPFNKSRYLDAPLKNVKWLIMRSIIKFQYFIFLLLLVVSEFNLGECFSVSKPSSRSASCESQGLYGLFRDRYEG